MGVNIFRNRVAQAIVYCLLALLIIQCSKLKPRGKITTLLQPPTAYEDVHHNITMRIFPSAHRLEAVDTVRVVRLAEKWSSLRFLLYPRLKITRLLVGSQPVRFKIEKIEALGYTFKMITIPKKALPPDQKETSLIFSYEGTVFDPQREAKGRIVGKIDSEDLYLYVEPHPWALGTQPSARLTLTLPKGWTVVSTGQLIKVIEEDTTVTYLYEMNRGEGVGIMAAKDYVIETFQVDRRLSISTYLFKVHAERAEEWAKKTKQVIALFSQKFGSCPFENLNIVEIRGPGGGAAHRMILLTMDDIESGPDGRLSLLVHEASHLWWGVSVEPKNLLSEDWLAEGFATYSELIYFESIGRRDIVPKLLGRWSRACRSIINKGIDEPLVSPHVTRAFWTLVYDKGAYVLHMLRQVVGDEDFFTILREFFRQYRGKLVTTADFQKVCEQVSDRDLDWFFEQWVRRPGAPDLQLGKVTIEQKNGRFLLKGHLLQKGKRIFTIPVEIVVATKGKEEARQVIWSEKKDTQFSFTLPGEPDTLWINPKMDLLTRRYIPRMAFVDGKWAAIQKERRIGDPKEWLYPEELLEEPGVRTVRNPDEGLWSADTSKVIKLRPLLMIDAKRFLTDKRHPFCSMAVDKMGNIFLLEGKRYTGRRGFGSIKKLTSDGEFLVNIAKKGRLLYPMDIAIDSQGIIYVSDLEAGRIEKFSSDGEYLGGFYLPFRPWEIALDSKGNIYVVPSMSFGALKKHLIFKFDEEGNPLGSFGKTLKHRYGEREAEGTLNRVSLCFDSDDNLYVSYQYGYRIQKYTSDGTLLLQFNRKLPYPIYYPRWTVIESPKSYGGGVFTPLTTLSIACDSQGHIYVLLAGEDDKYQKDSANQEIDVFDRDGNYLGNLKTGRNRITKIYIDNKDNLYLLDEYYAKKLYKFHLDIPSQ